MELYHILNRGVDKRTIFIDKKDYFRFMHDLFELNDKNIASLNNHHFKKSLQYLDTPCPNIIQSRSLLVKIHAFCLMPNHYHLLLSPATDQGIPLFMHKLNMGYAKYFNERYKRTGALFQGKYKSVPIAGDPHFSYISYYIHFNPLDLTPHRWRERNIKDYQKAFSFLEKYRWSSHLDYLGKKNFPSVTQREFLLDFFGGEKGYAQSVTRTLKDFGVEKINDVLLE